MKTLLLSLLIIVAGPTLENVYELYNLERYEEVIEQLEEFEINNETLTLKSFSYFKLKDYSKAVEFGVLAKQNSSDTLRLMLTEAFIALGNIDAADSLIGLVPGNLRKRNLKVKLETIRANEVKMVSETLKSVGRSNGFCLLDDGSILQAKGNELLIDQAVIYKSKGKYIGTPFFRKGQIFFCTNVTQENEAGSEVLSKISKKRISKLQLYYGDWINGKIENIRPFKYNNVEYDFIAPFLTNRGDLYYSSNSSGGLGGYDIYKCERLEKGGWDQPVNVGNPINTPFDDVYYHQDGNRIYYSSSGNSGLGKLDVFVTMEYKGEYLEMVNLGSKSNTGKSDFSFRTKDSQAYFMSVDEFDNDLLKRINNTTMKREVVYTAKNYFTGEPVQIHRVESVYKNGFRDTMDYISKDQPYPVTYPVDELFNHELFIESSGYEKTTRYSEKAEDEELILKPNFYGTVTDNITGEPLQGVKVYMIEFGDTVAKSVTGEDGDWWIALPSDSEYDIVYEYPGYQERKWKYPDVPVEISSIYGMSIENKKGNVLKIRNIYFELGKADLKEESKEILDRIKAYMEENPTCKIELSAHTDSRGSSRSNMSLSDRRANSAYQYLVEKGIESDRLVPKGYGESRLTNKCSDGINCSEEEHQENRRVEMTIL